MHVEIQVALNFVISFLYNKLPRRRVNQFGEELEKALKLKFEGHWYPEKPYKGSAFRCLKTAPPLDPVFEVAARESGMDLSDIQENLPQELSVWIDPGEVSYRMSEKGPVKVLYSESESSEENADREITRTFNPEAQCFKPIDSVASQLGTLSVSGSTSTSPYNSAPSPTYKSTSPVNAFIPKSTTPLTFTTATFAQTKFGSTKLKTSSKRSHRMSPTEFSNYIKQRAILQQQAQVAQQQLAAASSHSQSAAAAAAAAIFAASGAGTASAASQQHSRSLSPSPAAQQLDPSFMLMAGSPQSPQFAAAAAAAAAQNHFSTPATSRSAFGSASTAMFENANGYLQDIFAAGATTLTASTTTKAAAATSTNQQQQQQQRQPAQNSVATSNASRFSAFFADTKSLVNSTNTFGGLNFNLNDANNKSFGFDGVNFNLNAMPYPNQYQHLLVAN